MLTNREIAVAHAALQERGKQLVNMGLPTVAATRFALAEKLALILEERHGPRRGLELVVNHVR